MLLHMRQAPRCRARTRRGSLCQSPAMKNGRCRMHGGTSPGAPKGNKNAYKHGHYTADAIARRRSIATLIRTGKKLTAEISMAVPKNPKILNAQQSVDLSHRPTPSVVSWARLQATWRGAFTIQPRT